ncbi:MAG: hypothetical protein JWM41_2166 [Gemmatimonadetes bacterium]|nr:hypothetical protein [Gemmatimonadota bacterium]
MRAPDVVTSLRDRERGNLFHVWAYRALRKDELLQTVAMFYHQKKNRTYLKKGKIERVVKILTTHQ